MLIHLLVSLCVGALCGSVACKIMKGEPKGFLRNALLGIVGGIVGGLTVVCTKLNITVAEYCNSVLTVIRPLDLIQGLMKSLLFGMIVAAVGCRKGLSSGRDAQGVGRSATSAVVTSIFLIVAADALLTAIFAAIEHAKG